MLRAIVKVRLPPSPIESPLLMPLFAFSSVISNDDEAEADDDEQLPDEVVARFSNLAKSLHPQFPGLLAPAILEFKGQAKKYMGKVTKHCKIIQTHHYLTTDSLAATMVQVVCASISLACSILDALCPFLVRVYQRGVLIGYGFCLLLFSSGSIFGRF